MSIYVWEIFITSLFIQIGLALPMVFYFHRLSVSGLSANAIVVPVLSAIVPLGFIAIGLNSHDSGVSLRGTALGFPGGQWRARAMGAGLANSRATFLAGALFDLL